jgi:hypothetical protein
MIKAYRKEHLELKEWHGVEWRSKEASAILSKDNKKENLKK